MLRVSIFYYIIMDFADEYPLNRRMHYIMHSTIKSALCVFVCVLKNNYSINNSISHQPTKNIFNFDERSKQIEKFK